MTTWLKHEALTRSWCAVASVDDSVVTTHCAGSIATADLVEQFAIDTAPPLAEQCSACVGALAERQQREAAGADV